MSGAKCDECGLPLDDCNARAEKRIFNRSPLFIREMGYYWVRMVGYKTLGIAEWDSARWYFIGVEKGFPNAEVEPISPKLEMPYVL